jgi:hypothetical protein
MTPTDVDERMPIDGETGASRPFPVVERRMIQRIHSDLITEA